MEHDRYIITNELQEYLEELILPECDEKAKLIVRIVVDEDTTSEGLE